VSDVFSLARQRLRLIAALRRVLRAQDETG
jgi:hypothetical protein